MKRLTLLTLILTIVASGLIALQPAPAKLGGVAGYLSSNNNKPQPVTLFIFGATIDLTHPAETGAGAWTVDSHQVVSAHSYAGGHYFYYLKLGDIVIVEREDGSIQKYVVTRFETYSSIGNRYLYNGNLLLRQDVIAQLAVPNGIILHTCWTSDNGMGYNIIGGLFIVLSSIQ